MSKAREQRDPPTYVALGIDKEMLVRLQRPIRQQAEEAYNEVYGDLPKPGFGQFLGYLTSLGLDELRLKINAGAKRKKLALAGAKR